MKYYDLAKWERENAKKPDDSAELANLTDEEKVRLMRKKKDAEARRQAELARTALVLNHLKEVLHCATHHLIPHHLSTCCSATMLAPHMCSHLLHRTVLQAKDSNEAAFKAIQERAMHDTLVKPTFESIAKKRKEEQEAKIEAMKQKFK